MLLSTASLYAVVEVRSFADSLIQRSLPLTMALKYLLYFTPGMLKVIMPIASVVAALITLGILCRANEDTAMKAAGVSIFRISLPILLVTAVLCGCYFVIQDYVAPWTNQQAAQLRDEIEGRVSSVAIGGTRWLFGKDHRLYGYGDYEPDRKILQDVSVLELKDDPFRIRKRLWAPRVEWRGDSWVAHAGWTRGFKGDEEPYAGLSDTPLKWAETPDDFARHERSLVQSGRLAEELNFVALRRHIRKMKNSGYDTTRLRVSLYEKLAFPVAPLVMVLIGLPFAFRAGRRGSLYGMGIALLLVILYWSTFAVTSALGHEQILPPLLAAWAPNLLFTLTGGYLLLSTRS